MSSVGTTFSGPSSGNISISASVSNVQTATATTTDQGGVTNVFVGQSITITGDTNPANNGTFRITASSSAATGTISYFNPQVGAAASASSPALFTISALFTANGIATTPLSALVSQLDAAAGASTTTAIRNPHTGSSIGLNGGIFATS